MSIICEYNRHVQDVQQLHRAGPDHDLVRPKALLTVRPPSYNGIRIIIFRNYTKLMKMELVHLMYHIIIMEFFPSTCRAAGYQFHLKVGGGAKSS